MLTVSLSNAPRWLIGVCAAVALGEMAGSLLANLGEEAVAPPISLPECRQACPSGIAEWASYHCRCDVGGKEE